AIPRGRVRRLQVHANRFVGQDIPRVRVRAVARLLTNVIESVEAVPPLELQRIEGWPIDDRRSRVVQAIVPAHIDDVFRDGAERLVDVRTGRLQPAGEDLVPTDARADAGHVAAGDVGSRFDSIDDAAEEVPESV